MKRIALSLSICAVLGTLSGCEKAQQAIDAVDKAKTFSEDLQKNAAKKLQDAIPGLATKGGESGEGESGEKAKEEKGGNEEKDD